MVWTVAGVLAVALLAAILFWPRGGEEPTDPEDTSATEVEPTAEEVPDVEPIERTLYFPGEGGRLYGESRMLSPAGDLEQQIQGLVTSLLAGPQNTSLRSPMPESIRLRRAYLTGEDTVVLDLESPGGAEPPAVGSQREMLMVYSLVDTLVLNLDEIERVMLLWNGQQRHTLGGHLDTSRPLIANVALVAEGLTPPPLPPEPRAAGAAAGSPSAGTTEPTGDTATGQES